MSYFIDEQHKLGSYHRESINFAGRSDQEIFRQWGKATVEATLPAEGVEAGSYQTIKVRYRVGSLGLDEDGAIRFVTRFVSDVGTLQTLDPRADDYVTASTTGKANLELQIERKGNRRPFDRTLNIRVRNATLMEGEEILVILGDTSGGSRGWRQQTYVESPFPLRVSVDPLGTQELHELPKDIGWNIVPGPLDRYSLNVPSYGVQGEVFALRVKGEDRWGNPLRDLSELTPEVYAIKDGQEYLLEATGEHSSGVWFYQIRLDKSGHYYFRVRGEQRSLSNGIVITSSEVLPDYQLYWCDLHGQTGETVGSGTIQDYFHFARHYAFLDGCVHQGNDFQIGLPLWKTIKQVSNDAYDAGRFVTFQGYEWSGTTPMGGDHNVIYHEDNPPIYRSTGWLDGNPFEETAPLSKLYEILKSHRAMTIAHIGGRPASLRESDPEIEHLMEIHSAWGTFEWVYQEAFARGFKIGFVCNSDGHKCRPGASYPGAGIFGTLGGLTCILSKSKDRDAFWEALMSRRCYGTTGQRIVVDAALNDHPIGSEVRTDEAIIKAKVLGTAPILSVDLFRKDEVIETFYPAGEDAADTLVLRFGGARVKGRARMIRWNGTLSVESNTLVETEMNGIFSPNYGILTQDDQKLTFECVTTGNTVNFVLKFKEGLQGKMRFESNVTSFELDLQEVRREPRMLFEAPVDQIVTVAGCIRDNLPHYVEKDFLRKISHDDELPYFLRITQLDEGKAWTSPFYVAQGTD